MRGAGDQHTAENSPWGNSSWPWKTGWVIVTSRYIFYTCVWALLTPTTFNGIIWDFFSPQSQNGCGQYQGIHIRESSRVLAVCTQWELGNNKVHCTCSTLKGLCTSSFSQIQGSNYWGHWACWQVSVATERSDVGPYPSTHFHGGR